MKSVQIDPDGKKIVVPSKSVQDVVLNSVPKEMRKYIVFNKAGVMSTAGLADVESSSGNFNALRTLAMSETTVDVTVDNKFEYADENGDLKTKGMFYQGVLDDFPSSIVGPSTMEVGLLGATLLPGRRQNAQNSPDSNIKVIINSAGSLQAQSELFAHEAYGHAFIFVKSGGNYKLGGHDVTAGNKDQNQVLFKAISRAMAEVVEIFKNK